MGIVWNNCLTTNPVVLPIDPVTLNPRLTAFISGPDYKWHALGAHGYLQLNPAPVMKTKSGARIALVNCATEANIFCLVGPGRLHIDIGIDAVPFPKRYPKTCVLWFKLTKGMMYGTRLGSLQFQMSTAEMEACRAAETDVLPEYNVLPEHNGYKASRP